MKRKTLGAIIVLIVVLGGIYFFNKSQTSPQTPAPKTGEERAQILVREDSYQRGDPNAPVTIVEFVDFQCEACAYVLPITDRILDEYKDKARLVVRHWPLANQHKNAQAAAIAVEAAAECRAGRFWEMYERLLTRQSQWNQSDKLWDIFVGYAKDLDCDGFPTDFQVASNKFASKINRDRDDAKALSVKGIPNFFINGVNYGYIQTYDEFKEKVEKELALCDRTTMAEDDILNGRLLCSLD